MTIYDDAADLIAAEVATISLHLANDSEVTGSGYTRLAPTYAAASGGVADLASTLEFDGPSGTTPTQYGLRDSGGTLWGDLIPITSPEAFNSDNRLDLTSAPITVAAPE